MIKQLTGTAGVATGVGEAPVILPVVVPAGIFPILDNRQPILLLE